MKSQQSLTNGFCGQASKLSFIVKLHLALCGVNVHVHSSGINLRKQAADRISALHQGRVVAFQEGEIETAVFHRTPVNEGVVLIAGSARDPRLADKSPELEFPRGQILVGLGVLSQSADRNLGELRREIDLEERGPFTEE